MDEGKFVADFVAKNADKIWALAKQTFGVADEVLQIKLKTAYINYLSKTRLKYSKAKSFFIRNEPVDLYSYYVATGIKCGRKIIAVPSFRSCVDASNRIVICGSGGSGKSVLMRHLFLDCIADKTFAPILIELRDINAEQPALDDFINQTLETFGFNTSGDYVKRAKQAGHFCFFFDGYDEVIPTLRKKLIQQINNLSKKFPDCPVFISSRPDDVFNGIEEFSVFRMLPLELDSALNLVERLPFDQEIKEKFGVDLAAGLFEKHESFLSNPLLLSIMLLTYGENAEIPTKLSIFYNQAYEALFQRHDANKGGYSRSRLTALDIQDFSRIFSLFALQTYEKRLFKLSRTQCLDFIEKSKSSLRLDFNTENYLGDLLSAACLLVEEGLEIAFSHRSFQEYFVALHISSASPDVQNKLIERYWPNVGSDNVIKLLLEINPDLIERVLFVPVLQKLFSDIDVKRSVGITHLAKYFTLVYESWYIDEDRLSAVLFNAKKDVSTILHLAIEHCSPFKFPSLEVFKERQVEMFAKYGTDGKKVQFKGSELTYRSPFIIDISKSPGAFSVNYLSAGFEVLKELTTKHTNTMQDLDDLLGIR
jgi:hypothetical protein